MASIDQIELPNGQTYTFSTEPYWLDKSATIETTIRGSALGVNKLKFIDNRWDGIDTSSNNGATFTLTSGAIEFTGANGERCGYIEQWYHEDGSVQIYLGVENMKTDGRTVNNYLILDANKDGTAAVHINQKEAFREALEVDKSTSWVEVDHKAGTNTISVPSDAKEICCLVVINNTTIAWTFILPYVALSTTSYRYVNGYPSFSDGYIAVNVSKAQVSLNSVYSGQNNVTSNSILYLYARK